MSTFLRLMSEGSVFPYMLMDDADGDGDAAGGAGDDAGDDDAGDVSGIDRDKIFGSDKKADDDGAKDGDDADKKPADRPDFIAEKFWDPEKGEPRLEAMAKAYTDLEKKLHDKAGKPPKTPDDYKLEITEDMKSLFVGDDPAKDPVVQAINAKLHEKGVSQEVYEAVMSSALTALKEYQDESGPVQVDQKDEMEKLGKDARAIVGNQQKFLETLYKQGHVNQGQMEEILILTETADGIKALQALRNYYGDTQKIPTNLAPGGGIKSADELRTMQSDPRYGSDSEYTEQVDREYEKKYGTGTSGESQRSAL